MTDVVIGEWSAEGSGLYYSAFEDEVLCFHEDGTGSHEFARPGTSQVEALRWRRVDEEHLSITLEGRAAVVTRVTVAVEDTPLAGRVEVLRMSPAVLSATEFGRGAPSGRA
ncbi:hypothetical protein LX16_1957 [Stackebrandtia albiflava]|uniref:Lipocalin-like protein n=1 Tax=Stackebrandtia albiflava TaxID=406432 RepID=A0A562VEC8_9ACTN|nr:hypothetical protein [Stackebrandtia albiflava]TWJ16230.1 hypothetical protein LX16_1957 [Stackebrandtia albiflava]